FTDYLFAFELTSVLLIVAVVGAVVLARTTRRSRAEAAADDEANPIQLARTIFTDYAFAFEITSALLVIAVVGAVVLARRPASNELLPEQPEEVG
ncbi:MAG: NADH-quinone oxidoreductase subunit J, partial [Actinomycetota bacterium]